MTRFEQIGCNYQYLARTIEEATKNFHKSCNICCHCSRAMYNDCSRCAIEQTHNMIVANFTDEERNNKEMKRQLDEIPFDKTFIMESGKEEMCKATGFEVCLGNPNNPGDWWNEYEDSNGEIHYGR